MSRLARLTILSLAAALALPSAALAETWVIDPPHTVAGFTVRHMMVTNVHGAFEATEGTIEFVPGDPRSVKAQVVIQTVTINTRNQKRDDHLRTNDFLNAALYPTIRFVSRRVDNVRPGGFDLIGDLTIRDTTREVVLKVEGPAIVKDPKGVRRVGASATATINRKDFGVMYNRALEAGGVLVGEEVKITLEIEAIEKRS